MPNFSCSFTVTPLNFPSRVRSFSTYISFASIAKSVRTGNGLSFDCIDYSPFSSLTNHMLHTLWQNQTNGGHKHTLPRYTLKSITDVDMIKFLAQRTMLNDGR